MPATLTALRVARNGVRHTMVRPRGADTAYRSEAIERLLRSPVSSNQDGLTWTVTAPAVIPSIAMEIAKKARWYQVMTLRRRVSVTSIASVLRATIKRPAYSLVDTFISSSATLEGDRRSSLPDYASEFPLTLASSCRL